MNLLFDRSIYRPMCTHMGYVWFKSICYCSFTFWDRKISVQHYHLTVKLRWSSTVPLETWFGQDILWPYLSETHSGHGPTGPTAFYTHVIYHKYIVLLYYHCYYYYILSLRKGHVWILEAGVWEPGLQVLLPHHQWFSWDRRAPPKVLRFDAQFLVQIVYWIDRDFILR